MLSDSGAVVPPVEGAVEEVLLVVSEDGVVSPAELHGLVWLVFDVGGD